MQIKYSFNFGWVYISKLNAAKECSYNVHLVVDDVIIKYEDFLNTQRGAD